MNDKTNIKFTPGPWSVYKSNFDIEIFTDPKISERSGYCGPEVAGLDGIPIANMHMHNWSLRAKEQAHADAYLITAAPEMYELLSNIRNSLEIDRHDLLWELIGKRIGNILDNISQNVKCYCCIWRIFEYEGEFQERGRNCYLSENATEEDATNECYFEKFDDQNPEHILMHKSRRIYKKCKNRS